MNKSTCTICSDYLTTSNCTACPCGHTFHYECIMTWKERSATCPQCRVKFKEPIKLYFDLNANDTSIIDSGALKNQITDLELKLKEKDTEISSIRDTQAIFLAEFDKKESEISTLKQSLQNTELTNVALKRQLTYLEKFKEEAKRARGEVEEYTKKISNLTNIEELVKGERHEVENMVKNYADTPEALQQISASFIVLKKEFDKLKESKKRLENDRKTLRRQAEISAQETYESKEQLRVVTNDLTHLNEINKNLRNKLQKLEKSFQSESPRTTAIKRLIMESPAPCDLKKQFLSQQNDVEKAEESLLLFDDSNSGCPNDNDENINKEEEHCKQIANEFGLQYIPTTTLNEERIPLNDISQNSTINKNQMRKKISSQSKPTFSKLAHMKKGFNGMGGQSKVLIIPKKKTASSILKKNNSLKNEVRKLKIPKNNSTISSFIKNAPRLPSMNISP